MCLEKGLSFKKKSHVEFKAAVMDKMEEATCTSAQLQTTPVVEKAKISLTEGIASIKTRQKHIRIADRSEFG